LGRWGSKQPTLGISTTCEVGLGLKKKDLVVLGTLIAAAMPPFETFSLGSLEYPDRSTTLVIQVASFDQDNELVLSGPGIAGTIGFSARPLPGDFRARLIGNRALFPRGVDLIVLSEDAVAALPRSIRIAG